jgi:hypothetical protein
MNGANKGDAEVGRRIGIETGIMTTNLTLMSQFERRDHRQTDRVFVINDWKTMA